MITKANKFQQNHTIKELQKYYCTLHDKSKTKKNPLGYIIEWEVVIVIIILLLFHNVNLKYEFV